VSEKMDLVKKAIEMGHKIHEAAEAFDISRASYYRHENGKNSVNGTKTASIFWLQRTISVRQGEDVGLNQILEEIRSLIQQHPFWGYRKVHAFLKFRRHYRIGKKRVHRIMKADGLMGEKKRFKPLRPMRSKPRANRPNQFWGTDMTKFLIPDLGWVSLVVVMDWYTKMVLGWSVGLIGNTDLWLDALDMAVKRAFPQDGSRGKGVKLISDNGSQPTSRRYREACKLLEIEQIWTTYDNPKGNADTERLIRTIKEEAIWPYELTTFLQAKHHLEEKILFYNEQWCHMTLNNQSPVEFLNNYEQTERIRLVINQ